MQAKAKSFDLDRHLCTHDLCVAFTLIQCVLGQIREVYRKAKIDLGAFYT